MTTTATASPNGTGYTARTVTKPPDWHGLVAWDLLFNNLAAGLFLAAAVADLVAPERFAAVVRIAYPVALLFLVLDLICLVLDLGDPWRFHHMLRVFKPTSPMSLGTWCLTIYALPLTILAALCLFAGESSSLEGLRKIIVMVGILPALGSAAYKGVLLSTNAQPGWRDARWLGGYLTNSALMLGTAGLLACAVLLRAEPAATLLREALAVLIILNAIALFLLLADLRPTLTRIYPPIRLPHLALYLLGGGLFLPWFLLMSDDPYLQLTAVLCLLLGSLGIRFVIIWIPHQN
jgi:formate-dependent nitrite reductase membrane component NrfD